MKRMVLIVFVCAAVGFPGEALAQNWVDRFLSRYRAPSLDPAANLQTGERSVDAMIQSGTLPLTVGETIRLMLDNNPDVVVSRFSPLTNLLLIDSFLRPFEPTLRISGTVERSSAPSSSQLVGATALSRLTGSYSVGYSQALQTGTSVGVDFVLNRSSSNSIFNTFNPSYQSLVRYSVNQHLLRDYGRLANDRLIRIARNTKTISDIEFERQMIELVTDAQNLYWDLVFAREDISVKQRSLDLAQRTLHDNQRQVEIGTLAQIDVVQAESEVANRREQLVVSSYSGDQFQDRIRKILVRETSPLLAITKLNPTEKIPRPQESDALPVEAAIRYALENRPELRQLELDLRNRDIEVQYAKNQLLPTLDVFGSYSQNGVGGTQTLRDGFGSDSRVLSVSRGGAFDALGQTLGFDYTGYAVGFTLQIPLSNRSARAEYSRAQTLRSGIESRRTALAQQIALEVRNSLTIMEMNRARIEAAEKARELASRRLDAEQRKFQLGASTIRFVLEEQRNLAVAQTSEIQALVNYTKAVVGFDKAIGRTLRRHNVEVEKELKVASGPSLQKTSAGAEK